MSPRFTFRSAVALAALLLVALLTSGTQAQTPVTPPPGVKLPQNAIRPTLSEEVREHIAAIQHYYAQVGDFRVAFTQRYTSKMTQRMKESEGTADFVRPQKMRWDYLKPDRRSFISDGTSFWMVLWDEKEAKVEHDVQTSDLEGSVGFLWGGGNIPERFTVTRLVLETLENSIPVKGRILLELVPIRSADPFDTLYLLLDPATHRIEEVAFIDQLGNLNHLIFGLPERKKNFPPEHFRFTPPDKGWSLSGFAE